MKLLDLKACFAFLMLVAAVSCAKEQDVDTSKYETLALKAWIHQHRPDLEGNYQETGGYYVDVLDAGDPQYGPVNDTVCWVRFDYSGRDLAGNIVLTRNASEAALEGTFTRYTHYVPFYRYCGEENSSLLEGTWLALRNKLTLSEEYYDKYKGDPDRRLTSREVLLRRGSKVVLYLPSTVVGGSVSGTGGYEGQFSLDEGRPMIVTMAVCDTVKNPLEAEGRIVDPFCEDPANGGLRLYQHETADEESDEEYVSSIPSDPEAADHPYNIPEAWSSANDTIPQLYVNYRYRPDEPLRFADPYRSGFEPYVDEGSMASVDRRIAEALKERFGEAVTAYEGVKALDADSVKLDGTAKIWYIGRFLDGFIFDTNIDEVKQIVYGEVNSAGEALSYKPEDGGQIQAFYYIVPNLKFGQWAAFVSCSTHAYGASGKSGSTTTESSSSSSLADYYNYLNYLNYANSYYGSSYGGYYGGYYGSYMGGYYDPYYGYGGYGYGYGYGYDSGSSDSSTTTTTTILTEVPAFTPLLFQFYIEPQEE